jgi:microcompartment protein CcmK/EutM
MKRGLVVGEVWATRKAVGLDGRQLKLVVEYPGPGGDQDRLTAPTWQKLGLAPLIVAVDTLDVDCGQEVLLAYGSGARNVLHPGPDNRHELCDAAVAMLPEPDDDADIAPGPPAPQPAFLPKRGA